MEICTFDFSAHELNDIRSSIEKMNKFNQIEILRILHKEENIVLNENNYGVHVNLTDLLPHVVQELNTYIQYVNTQELTLHKFEKEKETCKNVYFAKDNKEVGLRR